MKTISQPQEQENNELVFYDIVRRIRPDVFILMDVLDRTGVNPVVLHQIARQIYNIAIGSGYGDVHVFMQKGTVVQIGGTDVVKSNEPAIVPKGS